MHIGRAFRSGNSIAVYLPSRVCRELGIVRGDYVAIYVGNDGFARLGKVELAKRPDLAAHVRGGLPVISVE